MKVEAVSRVDGHKPGTQFAVADDDPRLRLWLRAGNVRRVPPPPKTTKKKGG